MNHCSCRNVRQFKTSGLLPCAALSALLAPMLAHAQLAGTASAVTQYESNSNLFALDNGSQPLAEGPRGRTTDYSYGAAFSGTYGFGRQQLYGSGRVTQYEYQGFAAEGTSNLSHYEYSIDSGLKWQVGDALDGTADVSRTHTMVPFLDLSGTDLTLSVQTSQQESFQIGLKLDPEWKVDGSASTSKSTQPVFPGPGEPPSSPGAADQELTQSTGTLSLEYAGIGPLTTGMDIQYLEGDNASVNSLDPTLNAASGSYKQYMAGVLANYKLSRTSLVGQVGYSRRTSDDGRDNASGLTGSISFKDQLTYKTSFSATIERNIQTVYLNLGSEVDSAADFAINWQASYKVAVSLGYKFTYRAFPGQAQGPENAYPVDYEQNANVAVAYQPLRWLSITPYASVQLRRSNVMSHNFNSNIYGVTVTASVGDTGTKR